jgi:ABC-type multidrug transport system fused ATPase/permease subunit
MKSIGASSRIFYLLDRQPKVRCKGGKVLTSFRGEIEIRDVGFAYPSRSDTKVLHEFNLKLNPGQVVALVGPSGAFFIGTLLYLSFKIAT